MAALGRWMVGSMAAVTLMGSALVGPAHAGPGDDPILIVTHLKQVPVDKAMPKPEVTHDPARLDLGEIALGRQAAGTVTLTSPTDTEVTAHTSNSFLGPSEGFEVTHVTRWKRVMLPMIQGGRVIGQHAIYRPDQTAAGWGSIQVAAQDRVEISVTFTAGGFDLSLSNTGWYRDKLTVLANGWDLQVPLEADVTVFGPMRAIVLPHETSFRVLQGGSAEMKLKLVNPISSKVRVGFTPAQLPEGVTMDARSVVLNPNEVREITLPIAVSDSAPWGRDKSFTIAIDDGGNANRAIPVAISIFEPNMQFGPYNIKANDWVNGTMTVDLSSDGNWHWRLTLHDSSRVLGDRYFVGFYTNQSRADGVFGLPEVFYGWSHKGRLGSAAFGGQDQAIDEGAWSQYLHDNYLEVVYYDLQPFATAVSDGSDLAQAAASAGLSAVARAFGL